MEIRRTLRQPGEYSFVPRQLSPLPWRLSAEAFQEVNRRVRAMVYPHNTERPIKKGKTFLNYTAAAKKMKVTHLVLLVILPTVLRDYIQPFRRGLRLFVLGLRMLEGQVHSYNTCVRLGVEPGSRCLDKKLIPEIKKLVVGGLSMITGSVPPSSLVQYLHVIG